jgi:hypothetical protein
MVPEHL